MRGATPIVLTVVAVVTLAGCSSSAEKPRGTKTVFVTQSPSVASSSPSTPASSGPAAPTPPASMSKIKGDCDSRLGVDEVGPAIGESLAGDTQFVVGQPDKSIKRLAYINCRYGLSDPNAVPVVEIQVSLYPSAAVASARITATVSDYGDNGATAKDVSAGGIPAHLLTGGTGADYELPTMVAAFGQRTIAVSVSDDIDADKQESDLLKLTVLAATRTQ